MISAPIEYYRLEGDRFVYDPIGGWFEILLSSVCILALIYMFLTKFKRK